LTPSPLFNGLRMNRDPRDLWEFLLHAVFERGGDIVDLRDRQAAIHRAMAGSQNFVFHLADVHFVAGMIGHHAQAIQMAGWAPSHGASPAVRVLCERIVVAQNDEIAFAQRWLREHNEVAPPADPRGHVMPGMDHPMLMPGMLTPEQMAQLDAARGGEFDRLFLKGMIQHHQGALTMVAQLLAAPGAAQDGPIFRFAADVNADQTTEIDRMTRMLDDLKRSAQ